MSRVRFGPVPGATAFVVALIALVAAGCQSGGTGDAAAGAVGFRSSTAGKPVKIDPSVARDFMRLDRLCWFISVEWNSTIPRDGVTLVVRFDTGSMHGGGADFKADTAREAIRRALAEIEDPGASATGLVSSEQEILDLTEAFGIIKEQCWFLRLEKSGDWTATARESVEGELTSSTLVARNATLIGVFDDLCEQLEYRSVQREAP